MTWNADFAYIVGLITTDGNLSKDGRHLDVTSKDLDQIENVKKILNLENKIGTKSSGTSKNRYFRIQFGNVKLYRFLLKIGLVPNKSTVLGKILVPTRYFRDFLRGHFDGDGSLYTYLDLYNHYRSRSYQNQRVYLKFHSASEKHILWLQERILTLTELTSSFEHKLPQKDHHAGMWDIKFSKHNSIKLLKWIYYKEDLPCLKRKRLLAKHLLDTIPFEQRRKYQKIENNTKTV